MPNSDEIRRLNSKWQTNTGWPKRLEWVEIDGLRGWTRQRFELRFPIMAVVGENGVGKSTVLQSAASVYRSPEKGKERFASDFFPDTPWDKIRDAKIRYSVREGDEQYSDTIRKPSNRWRGNPERKMRNVEYIDLSRVQPVSGRLGYKTLANPAFFETEASPFEKGKLARFSGIMGRTYELAKMAVTDQDSKREVPVVGHHGASYSGFHQGAGETTVAELLQADMPRYSLVLIDEVESSLHPRAQRRLVRDLAAKARELELQIVITTHSPYVLEELPFEARACIVQTPAGTREIVYGVSPEFAMTKMDDIQHSECDVYVEDAAAATMLTEILIAARAELVGRCQVVPFGASSVGKSLGQMILGKRFPRPSCVFLDGDEGTVGGCHNLPGEDAPERVVFEALRERNWLNVHDRTGRAFAEVADACGKAMALPDHHQWLRQAASNLFLSSETLWQAMCAEWASNCLDPEEATEIAQAVEDALIGVHSGSRPPFVPAASPVPPDPIVEEEPPAPVPQAEPVSTPEPIYPNGTGQLFELSPTDAQG
ncbi:MAG TPA: AAA family ATPase [Solirubrobacterales bacterium]|nr:AAA family ATPase [Solirubrobacterales bacterium]